MLTRNQTYAIDALEKVSDYKKNASETDRKSYGSMCHKLPILIHTSGLAQALTFAQTRDKEPLRQMLNDLAATVGQTDGPALAKRARELSLNDYMLLTRHVLAALLWYKRFAQSELDVEADEGE
jgi:CRISPR-associated protein Cmr5